MSFGPGLSWEGGGVVDDVAAAQVQGPLGRRHHDPELAGEIVVVPE